MDPPKLPPRDSSIPLIARLDHLEFIMKYLERKQRYGSNNVPADKQSSDWAMKEAYFKGTLLDRVASLEHRVRQLCEEMDSSGSSLPVSRVSTQDSSSSQGSKGEELSYSFPNFNISLPKKPLEKAIMPQNHHNTLQLQGKSEMVQHQRKNSSPPKQAVKNRAKKNEKKSKNGKKQTASITWPHLKLLGC